MTDKYDGSMLAFGPFPKICEFKHESISFVEQERLP